MPKKTESQHPLARRTLTVRQLMEYLEDCDQDLPVVISADYGDHCNTMQALAVDEVIDSVEVVESGYSKSGYAVPKDDASSWDDDEDDDDDEEKEEPQRFVVIR